MREARSYGQKARQFFIVLLPILITQVAIVSTGFFDTVMAGHVSEYDLAGVAVAANIFFPIFGSTLGVISGLTPMIAQLYGAGRKEGIPYIVAQGMYMAFLLGVTLLCLGALGLEPLLSMMGLEAPVSAVSRGYMGAIALGLCPLLVSSVLRNFIDALGYTRVTMVVTILAVPFNIVMNYLFIFGKLGLPALGGIGAGVGSAITYWFILLMNVAVVRSIQPFSAYGVFKRLPRPDWRAWREYLTLGIPIGTAVFCEQSIFGVVGLLMAAYGTTIIAAHQAALNFTTMVYMLPLSISMTLAILVGFEVGARRLGDARRYSYMGSLLSVLFAGSLVVVLANFRAEIAALYTNEPAVQILIQRLMMFAMFLQFADAFNAPLQGALRGYKDVRITLLLAVLSYWIIGLPAGYLSANYAGLGPFGYWVGLIVGVAIGGIFLLLRLRYVQRRINLNLQRVDE